MKGGAMETILVRRPAREASSRLRLERRADGFLWAVKGDVETPVTVRRCFPWSEPYQHLSLRDKDDNEVAMVRHPAELDEPSRVALEEAVREAGFAFVVTRVIEVEEEVELRHWQVETEQGARSFQTRLDDWPRQLPGGGFLIRDVGGDLYRLENPSDLDKKSRELLWSFVD
jgi:hypothetical protein